MTSVDGLVLFLSPNCMCGSLVCVSAYTLSAKGVIGLQQIAAKGDDWPLLTKSQELYLWFNYCLNPR